MSITTQSLRVGNFTSSRISDLFGTKAAVEKYIKQKNQERRLGRSLSIEKGSRATHWGHFMEKRVHNLLPNKYSFCGDKTIAHPHIPFWVGTPDNVIESEKVVGDTKAYELESFCNYYDVLITGDIQQFKEQFTQQYWQLVSNACILNYSHIEAILYVPYESELAEIREQASNYDGDKPWQYRFIYESAPEELPLLPDNGYYKNLAIFRFEVPKEDKLLLESKVLEAGRKLITPHSLILTPDKVGDTNLILVDKA